MRQAAVVIVGAGHGGATAAAGLRKGGFAGSILMIDAGNFLPYERPPLSKDYLSGERSPEHLLLRSPGFWENARVELLLGSRVASVDPDTRRLLLDDQSRVEFGHLIWACGGEARRLNCPGADRPAVHYLRTRNDADRLRDSLDVARRVVIIGAGYIGLECAATLRKADKSVTVLEAADRVLARVTGPDLSRFIAEVHRSHGVDLRLSAQVERLADGSDSTVAVICADGASLPADIVIAGIGIVPSVAPLLAAGAQGGNGVAVDAHCRTSLPGISAIGDCALHENPFAQGRRIRLESVQNAVDMAGVVADDLNGRARPYHSVPWFWSSQYDLKIQTIGLFEGHDGAQVARDPSTNSFSVHYLKGEQLLAVDCVNASREFAQARPKILAGLSA